MPVFLIKFIRQSFMGQDGLVIQSYKHYDSIRETVAMKLIQGQH